MGTIEQTAQARTINGRTCTFTPARAEHPYVSVLVPVYNAAPTLTQALDSLRAQTFSNIEVVVVDDASTDESPAVIRVAAASDPRIAVLTHTANAGYGAGMNDALSVARGEWVAILEPDDWFDAALVETLLKAASPHESRGVRVDVVKAAYWRVSHETGSETISPCAYHKRVKPVEQPFALGAQASRNLFQHHPSIWSGAYRTAFLREEGISFPEYPGAGWADNEFFYRTLLAARAIVYVDTPLYFYREDTPAEELAFFKRNATLPLRRWLQLDAIVNQLHVQAEPLLAAHTVRGFDYLDTTIRAGAGSDPAVIELRDSMFAKMDAQRVFAQALIPPRMKELFAQVRNVPFDQAAAKRLYRKNLVAETAYLLRNNGPAYYARHAKNFLKRP